MNVRLVSSLVQIINSLTEEERESLENQLNKDRVERHKILDIDREPFVDMWSDRQDLTDSSKWVKQLKQNEWSNIARKIPLLSKNQKDYRFPELNLLTYG